MQNQSQRRTHMPTDAKLRQLLAIAKGWAERELDNWTECSHRKVLRRHGAVPPAFSSTQMDSRQLSAALGEYKSMGFVVSSRKRLTQPQASATDWRKPRISKLNAMWIELHEHGAVDDRSERAMHQWCRNQLPALDALQFANSDQLNLLVEALKRWLLRVQKEAKHEH